MRLWLPLLISLVAIMTCASCASENGGNSATGGGSGEEAAQSEATQPGGAAIPSSPGAQSRDGSELGSADVPPQSGITDTPPQPQAGAALPDEWPSDIPIYSGLTIRGGQPAGEDGYMIGAVGNADQNDVLQFYDSLEGWERVASGDKEDADSVTRQYTRGSEELEVYVRRTDDGILLRLTYYDRTETDE